MSYYSFVACNRPLMPGEYGVRPDRIYSSYAEYMASPDYRSRSMGGEMASYRLERSVLPGKIYFYEQRMPMRNTWMELREFPVLCNWIDEYRTKEEHDFIRKQFSLRYIYWGNCQPDFICKYLRPNDRLESLSIFLGHGEPLVEPIRKIIDLQDYADGLQNFDTLWNDIPSPPANTLITYVPPQITRTQYAIESINLNEAVCVIYGNMDIESWNTRKLRKMGLV